MCPQKFVEISKSFFVDADFKDAFERAGLTSIDAVFAFNGGVDLSKKNLSAYRSRIRFEINSPAATLFLKRYDKPSVTIQLKNWLAARQRISCGLLDRQAAEKLTAAGINTPKTIAYGQKAGVLFEKRSFCITEKIPAAESLERKLPACFDGLIATEVLKLRREFIAQLAAFVKKFHQTGFRHRDLYFSHIFYCESGRFYLIDLARAFKPAVFAERYRVKDIAQLYYSAPAEHFSKTDRLRFFLAYSGQGKDKRFIAKVKNKARRIARHDRKRQG